jgi:hypothetical protein
MVFDGIVFGVVLFLSLFVYFIPTLVAGIRHHPNTTPIFIINFFAGWTIVGYVVSLAWAFIAIDHGDADIKPRRRSRF